MSGWLVDTNVLLDVATADPNWLAWSDAQLRTAAAQGRVVINPIIYAELAPAFASEADLDRWLDPAVFDRLPLPYAAGWPARAGVSEVSKWRRHADVTAARFLHRCARPGRKPHARHARPGAVSHVLSRCKDHCAALSEDASRVASPTTLSVATETRQTTRLRG
jgi:hypothetical protein